MKVRILGAHNLPSSTTEHTCFLIDDVLGLDMGALSAALSPEEQGRILAVLLTHRHFDHIRDIPSLALMTLNDPRQIDIYSLSETLEGLHSHLIDGDVYPDFTKKVTDAPPKYRLNPIQPWQQEEILGYQIMPIPQTHPVPSIGYVIRSSSGSCMAYTGDTGGNISAFFETQFAPQILFVDVTFPSQMKDLANLTGHLTPALLKDQLEDAVKAKHNLPKIVAVHLSVPNEKQVSDEIESLAREMGIDLTVGSEGNEFDL